MIPRWFKAALAFVTVLGSPVPVFAAEMPLVEGKLSIPVPLQVAERPLQLRVSALGADGRLQTATASFQTKGTFAPEIPPYRPPHGCVRSSPPR